MKKYIDVIQNDYLCSHSLHIEIGRYSSIERCNRICNVCYNNQVESVCHFVLCCPFYSSLRTNYFGKLPCPNVQPEQNDIQNCQVFKRCI